MWFDVQAALAETECDVGRPEPASRLAHLARLARAPALKPEKPSCPLNRGEVAVIGAVRGGKRRPGAVATQTGLGASVTYRLIDHLVAEGLITVARDGELAVAVTSSKGRKSKA